ncbi:hypothetical protein SUGI_0645850 [Cryptomeria japonica]|uniref:protein GRAVITROPIC IN THE LIGHT 1 n=1 Tax=Cryptomeria japonica TaxID=3369 RepID=UPI0024147867|nr:protein GRAVITROPIC IN THE LIGHT 1 [Cryptomeria japonica]GLJ32072.1 hypothetical protein SUGI_0645850 [Cryptomeria japonica]
MCSTSGSIHVINFIQKKKGSCSKPGKDNAVEPTKLSSLADQQQKPYLQLEALHEDSKEKGEEHDDHGDQKKIKVVESVMDEIFSTIYRLKISYTQLQAAHVPYNEEKLQIADKGVIKELKRLSELKHYYNENVARLCIGFKDEGSSKSAVEDKEMEIKTLKSALEKVTLKKQELQKRVKRIQKESFNDGPIVKLLEFNMHNARESAKSFTECLMSFMKHAKWDLEAAANSIEPGVKYSNPAHRKLAFESYICMKMFQGFENETFYLTGSLSCIVNVEKHRKECFQEFQSMQNVEPLEMVSVMPDCLFGKFCLKKFLEIVHHKMESSFFGNFEHRNQILNGVHPRSPFYSVFLKFAKSVWLLHKLSFSLDPPASVFFIRGGEEFNGLYMENLAEFNVLNMENPDSEPNTEKDNSNQIMKLKETSKNVGFTVMPGFRHSNKILLRGLVYAPTITADSLVT